jgi:LPS-assembly protein
MRLRGLVILALCLLMVAGLPRALSAQDKAALIADHVQVDPAGRLVAEGGVEVYFQGRTLRASRITYDQQADRLLIEGPIVMVDGAATVFVAEQADLSADLTEGILQSARLVLNRELQLAASQIQRIGGRYTRLDNVVASSCKVCASNPTPLWEIRARRVIHDTEERQIYFDNAQFRMAGVPLAYLPRLRIPDPTLKRASGFLAPIVRTTSGLGTGVKLPYFLAIGPSRDLTITPYLSTESAQALEMRYRQAFRIGTMEVRGSLAQDQLVPGETRSYLEAIGQFGLPRDFKLSFIGIVVSDAAYLRDYGLPERDRLVSQLEVTRTRRNEYISGRLAGIQSTRDGEVNSTLPTIISDVTYHRRFSGGPLGGEAGLRFQTHGHYRSSDDPFDSALDTDTDADGRDTSRMSLRLDWRRNWVLPMGMVGTTLAEISGDAYNIRQDAVFGGNSTRLSGGVGAELRWPWMKTGPGGVSQVIEPVVQIAWADASKTNLPNEDSRLVEFDEANLFDLNRFPGSDAFERGGRLNIGITHTRIDPAGWTMSSAFGRVLRDKDLGQFSASSGLDGKSSDWLAAIHIAFPQGFSLGQRMLLDDSFSVTKFESRFDLTGQKYGVSGSYIWVDADAAEDRLTRVSELVLDGNYQLRNNWTAFAAARYDFEADRANRAAVGLQYRNECVSVDLSLSRRLTSSTSVGPTTDFGLSVNLVGIGGAASAGPSRACR